MERVGDVRERERVGERGCVTVKVGKKKMG